MFEEGKAIVFEKPNCAVVKKIKLSEVDDESIVAETKYSGISSGTEMKVYTGLTGALDGNLWYPLIPGYEEVGEVVYIGKKVRHITTNTGEKLNIGDRVMFNEIRAYPDYCAAWGGQVKYGIKNLNKVKGTMDMPAKIPKNVSYQEAVVAYLSCVAKKGLDKVGVKKNENFLVIGMGNIGLSAIQLAKLRGAKVIAMDINEDRLKLASKYTKFLINSAKSDAVKSLKDMTDGKLADVIFECSGNPAIVGELYKFIKDGGWGKSDEGGRIHLQGDYPAPIVIFPYSRWFVKNVTLSMTCALKPGDKEAILDLISKGKFDAKSLYTKECNVDDAPKAYEELKKNRYSILKILLKW